MHAPDQIVNFVRTKHHNQLPLGSIPLSLHLAPRPEGTPWPPPFPAYGGHMKLKAI